MITTSHIWVVTGYARGYTDDPTWPFRAFADKDEAESFCEELNDCVNGITDILQGYGTSDDSADAIAEAEAQLYGIDPEADMTTRYYIIEVPLGAIELP